MDNRGGQVDPVRGPFTYWLKEVPNDEVNRKMRPKYQVGPTAYIMQRDADGNDYEFAEISPLMDPASVERVMRRLTK